MVRETGLSEHETAYLYGTARDLPPEERMAYVEAACEGKPEQRAEVLALLECAEPAEAFFSRLQEHILSISLSPESDGKVSGQEGPAPFAHDLPPGSTVARYQVSERIGSGGMGAVYSAHDPLLKRDVALKLLPHHLSSDAGARDRFLVEARAAAALDHPNICTIHEVGEAEDGRPFLAMARYEGETLKERIARGPLPVSEAVPYMTQLARALAAAHSRGIVHRDVKPGNVMLLPDGMVKLLDFGLARMADVSLTRPGTTPGTVAYMSPEQVRGDEVDHRTDLFSLGVVFYEMLTGVRPFRGESEREVLAAIAHQEPEHLRTLRPETPEAIARVLERLLQKDPAARYDTAEGVLADMEGRAAQKRPQWRGIAIRRPVMVLAAVAVLLAVPALFLMMQPRSPILDPQRVVVAAFENRTGDPALDPVGGMAADWITHGLAQTGIVEVVPPSVAAASARNVSAAVLADPRLDPKRALAEETGAGIVVSGSYYRSGDSLRLQAQITNAREGRVLHVSEPVTGPMGDPTVPIELLRRRTLGALAQVTDDRLALHGQLVHSPPTYEAYRAYAEGMEAVIAGRWLQAIDHHKRAAALDSTYMSPLILMAVSYWNLRQEAAADSLVRELDLARDRLTPHELALLDLVRSWLSADLVARHEAAKRAAAISPGSLTHVQWGVETLWLNRPREALEIFAQIDPERGPVRGWTTYWRAVTEANHLLGRHRQESREARRARALYPDEPAYLYMEARALAALGRPAAVDDVIATRMSLSKYSWPQPGLMMLLLGDEFRVHGHADAAQAMYQRALDWHMSRVDAEFDRNRATLAYAHFVVGQWQEAHALFEQLVSQAPDEVRFQGALGALAARRGDHAEAERIVAWLRDEPDPPSWRSPGHGEFDRTFWRACIAAQLGQKAEAVALLQEAVAQGHPNRFAFHSFPFLDPLRDYPPFRELMRPKG